MRDMVNLSVRLFIIAMVAALALAATNMITKGPIEQQALETATAARQQVMPADDFQKVDVDKLIGDDAGMASVKDIYLAKKGGETVGATVELAAKGYGGDIILTVGVNMDGSVNGMTVNSHSETASLGSRVTEEGFQAQFPGKDATQPVGVGSGDNDISAISGATISSRAVAEGVTTACKAALLAMGGEGQ